VNDGVNQYLYDGDGRVCAVASTSVYGDVILTGYVYNPGGQRVSKGTITTWSCDPAISGFTATNDYVLGPNGEQVTEMAMGANKTMSWQHTNVYAAGNLFATYDNNGLHFHFNDELGTRRVQTDYAGVMEQTCSGLPFGDSLDCSNSIQFPTEHHFTGKERDAESGNDYFGARYYASSMGRFMSPDSYNSIIIRQGMKAGGLPDAAADSFFNGFLENPQNWNKYTYALNSPLRFVDPTGAAPAEGHHLIPERDNLGVLGRDFANKIKTGPLSGNGAPNQPGFNAAHREYNDAVREMLDDAVQKEGPSETWDINKWKDFANKVLSSDEPAIKNFLDELEENNPGAKAALASSLAAYRVSASVIARAVAGIIAADIQTLFGDFLVCATCQLEQQQERVTHRMYFPAS
jgi:RHS repeat-associated protein